MCCTTIKHIYLIDCDWQEHLLMLFIEIESSVRIVVGLHMFDWSWCCFYWCTGYRKILIDRVVWYRCSRFLFVVFYKIIGSCTQETTGKEFLLLVIVIMHSTIRFLTCHSYAVKDIETRPKFWSTPIFQQGRGIAIFLSSNQYH